MPITPALMAAIRATTVDSTKAPGAHDAIVIGGGAIGGMAALLLTEAGLRVLVLDASKTLSTHSPWRRGMNAIIRGLGDPSSLRFIPPAAVPLARAALRSLRLFHQPVQSKCIFWPLAPELYVDDAECPYTTEPNHAFTLDTCAPAGRPNDHTGPWAHLSSSVPDGGCRLESIDRQLAAYAARA